MGSNPASPTISDHRARLNGAVCGRFVGNFATEDLVAELLAAGGIDDVTVEDGVPACVSNFNTAPTSVWPVFIVDAGHVRVRSARWGLVPS